MKLVISFTTVFTCLGYTMFAAAQISHSGQEKLPEFGGPESVSVQSKRADEEREALYRFDGLQAPASLGSATGVMTLVPISAIYLLEERCSY